jgi:hypothetical protein
MSCLLAVSWLPESTAEQVLDALSARAPDHVRYLTRVSTLQAVLQEMAIRLVHDGEYGKA